MELDLTSLARLEELLAHLPAAAVLFSGPTCSICHAVAPRLRELFETEFPKLAYLHVDIDRLPDAAVRYRATALPTLLLFFEGKEHHRFVRVFGMAEVRQAIARPYELLFGA
jgi:thiol-disulfide isomerase/thioredoxin